jgi:asparagine synthase (glutamine-hydrolysing)
MVAEHFDTDHHRLSVSNRDLLPTLTQAIAAMSEPMASHDAVAFYLLAEEASKVVTVAQSGQGADEVFAGYRRHQVYRDVKSDGLAEYVRMFDRSHSEIVSALSTEYTVDDDPSYEFVAAHFTAEGAETDLDRVTRLDLEVTLTDDPLKRVDNMTMAWAVEGRVPFLDRDLVMLGLACPPELKLAKGGKGILKEAARGVLPSAIVDRPKGDFPVPALMTLHRALLDLARDALLSSSARTRRLFRREYVEGLLATSPRTPLGDSKLWQLAVLELWLEARGL